MTNNLKERFLFFFSPLTGWKERKKERKNETKNKIKIKRKYKILESDTDVDDDGLSPFSVRNSLTSNVDLFHFEPLSPPPRLPPLSPKQLLLLSQPRHLSRRSLHESRGWDGKEEWEVTEERENKTGKRGEGAFFSVRIWWLFWGEAWWAYGDDWNVKSVVNALLVTIILGFGFCGWSIIYSLLKNMRQCYHKYNP